MTARQALEVLARSRGDKVVITTMTAVGVWPELSDTPRDFAYMPSAMGHGFGLALGMALAQPGLGVILITGDGSALMNLGGLVTVAQNPADVCLIILDNGLYEVTGGQPTPGAGRTDFAALARAAGIGQAYAFDDLNAWEQGAAQALSAKGPSLVWLSVEGKLGQKTPRPPRPMSEQIVRLRQSLGCGYSP
jgi:thiamine pyrophosphate-dependent acetolactate synthase large subunit-like protein